jgi:proteasome lid subunit RPN8/RPN11
MNNNKQISTNLKIQTSPNREQHRSNWPIEQNDLAIRFSPTAWAKLVYFRDKSGNEVGGFGITELDDLLFVREFVAVKQEVTAISVKFDDTSVADFFDSQVDLGRKPEQFARIWLHSHPGDSPYPSAVDEETFQRVFGKCQWAVMFVVSNDNKTYAKLRFNVGPGGQILIPAAVDYGYDFGPSDHGLWDAEYTANITAVDWLGDRLKQESSLTGPDLNNFALPYDFLEGFEQMEPEERQFILDELADRPDLWDQEEVITP